MAQEDGGVKFLLPQQEPVAGQHEMRQPPFVTYPFGGVKMLLLGYSVDSNHQVNFVEFGGGSSKSTSSSLAGAGGGEEDSGKEDEYDDEGASPESQCQSDEEENEEEEEDLSASAGEQRKHDEQDEDERMSDYTSSNEDTDPGDEAAAGAASRDELMASKSSAGGETESGSVPASATVSEGGRHPDQQKQSAEVEGDDAMSLVHEPEPLSVLGYERGIEVRGVPVTAKGALLKAPTRAGSGAAGTRNTNGHLVHMGKEAAAAEGESAGGSDGVETGGTTTTSANGTAEPKGRSSGTGGKLVTEKQSQSGNGSEGRRQQATTTRPGATSRAGKGMTGDQFLLSSGSVGANANNSSGPNAGELPQLKKGKSDDHGRSQQGAAAASPRNPSDNSQAPKGVAKSAQMKAPAAAATPATTEAPPALKARGSKSLQAQQAIQQISLSNSVAQAKQHGLSNSVAQAKNVPQRTARPQQRHHQAVLGAGGIQHQQQQQRPPGTNGGKNPNHPPAPQTAATTAHSSTTTTQTSRHLYTQRVVLDPNALTHLPNFQRLSDLHDPWSAFSSSVIQAIVEIPPHVKKAWSFLPCGDVDDVLCNPKFGLERFPGVYEAKPKHDFPAMVSYSRHSW